jgi:tetratricopeptide (TPR) repeat protein
MPPVASQQPRASFDTLSVWAIAATIILAAIIVIPSVAIPFVPTKTFVLGAGAIIALALFILARLTRGNAILPPVLLLGALWLPAIAYALSTVFGGANTSLAIFGASFDTDTFGFILVATVLGTLAALALRRTSDYRGLFRALGWALGVIVALEILILVLGQFIPNTIAPSFSLLGSYSDLGVVAGLGLVLSLLALRLTEVASRLRIWLFVLGAAELLLLALANSTLLWVLVALTALALFVEAVMRRTPAAHSSDFDLAHTEIVHESPSEMGGERSLVGPLVVLAIALFFLIGSSLGNALSTGLHTDVLNVRPSWQSTLATGSSVYHSSPVFGSGPDTFGSEWLKARSSSLNSTVFWNVDFTTGIGYLPTSFVTTGLVGALAWLLLLGAFLYMGLRVLLLRTPEDATARFTALAAFVAFSYLAAVAIFSEPGPVVLALLFVFAGVFASTVRYARGYGQWGVVFGKSPKVGFAIVFALTLLLLAAIGAAYVLIEQYVAQVELTKTEAALSSGNLTGASADATSALSFAPLPAAYLAEASVAGSELSQIANDTSLSATEAQQQFQAALSSGINAALTATRLTPNDYNAWLALGNLYAAVVPLGVDGAYANAKSAYQKAESLNPTSPNIPYLMAELDVADKNNASAIADLEQAITLKQDDTQAIFLLSQLEVASGNVKDALAAAEAAAYFDPTDPNVLFQVGLLEAASNDLPDAISALSAAVKQSPQFANARYYLAVAYAAQKDYADAITQLQAIAALSSANATAVAPDITSLQAGKDPFPASLLAAPAAPLTTPATATSTAGTAVTQ